ncbi:MAG: hypothetical protein NWT08_13875 [Akkermansiaceae bacterium]|jgi:putative oxidoreductase|nr:hypothetical protein [Akkermansiaceae bacterium]MDP4646062.1 hypothetical protein [Akkermansiaceae bacterium]MDP4720861.1 hypothetical protein [Akkermansiaceae bacterium]MDP4780780.1 hypothetical protein [Akkermansiaceae bacterium]MDP4845726.1 hypothetical protein [Akkermansiaceae bacterium]
MKYASHIAGGLHGLLFVVFGLNFFLNFIPMPPGPPEGSPPALFFAALFPTGYLAFVKVLEILGGILVAIPKTRVIGLLVLGPIIINILAFHVFLLKGAAIVDPVIALITLLPLFLVWKERSKFTALLD